MKWHRELRQAAAETGLDFKIENGGKHLRIELENGKTVTASCTPSDVNAIHQVRRDLRRATAPTPTPTLAPPPVVLEAVAPLVPEPTPILVPAGPDVLYHFTSSALMPSIIEAADLQPGEDGLLWATTNEDGDRCAAGYLGIEAKSYRHGSTLRVRFAFAADGFKPWREVVAPSKIAELEQVARERGQNPDQWYAKRSPVTLDDCLVAHCRSYTTHRWIELSGTDRTDANVFRFHISNDGGPDRAPPGEYYGLHFLDRVFFVGVDNRDGGIVRGSVNANSFINALQEAA
jgi:hypothetical protein